RDRARKVAMAHRAGNASPPAYVIVTERTGQRARRHCEHRFGVGSSVRSAGRGGGTRGAATGPGRDPVRSRFLAPLALLVILRRIPALQRRLAARTLPADLLAHHLAAILVAGEHELGMCRESPGQRRAGDLLHVRRYEDVEIFGKEPRA